MRPTGAGVQAFAPDSANPKSPFADVRVRQAAAYAIDNPTLIKGVFGDGGGATPTNQLTYKENWAFNLSVVGYPYDPAKAKQLLTAAGYPNGFQTTLQSYNDSARVTYATGVQSYLKAVGIDATLTPISGASINDFQFNGKTWQGLTVAKFPVNPDWVSIMSTSFHGNGSYVNMLTPDDYIQAIDNALSAPDFATEQKFAQQAMQLALDKYCLIIPTYANNDTKALQTYVHGTGFFETTINVAWTPENAWLAKK